MKRKRSVKAKSYHTEDKLHKFHILALFYSLPTQSYIFFSFNKYLNMSSLLQLPDFNLSMDHYCAVSNG